MLKRGACEKGGRHAGAKRQAAALRAYFWAQTNKTKQANK